MLHFLYCFQENVSIYTAKSTRLALINTLIVEKISLSMSQTELVIKDLFLLFRDTKNMEIFFDSLIDFDYVIFLVNLLNRSNCPSE